MRTLFNKQHFFTLAASVLLSVFMVAVVAWGATMTISNVGIGSGSSTPGAAVGAKGAGLFEGFVHADYFRSTSTASWGIGTSSPGVRLGVAGPGLFEGFVDANYFRSSSTDVASGFGTTSPGAEFAVAGGALFDGRVTASSYAATSTVATSTIKYGLDIASSSLQVDGVTGKVAIGTSTLPLAQNIAGIVDPALTVTGVGNTGSATGTLYVAGGVGNGGQIIMKSTDGTRCVSITATSGGGALDAAPGTVLTLKVVACPR